MGRPPMTDEAPNKDKKPLYGKEAVILALIMLGLVFFFIALAAVTGNPIALVGSLLAIAIIALIAHVGREEE